MWKNFDDMPPVLRLITGSALTGIVMLILSLNPYTSFELNAQQVTYAVWWSSGAGPFASFLGVIWPLSGYLLLKRSHRARIVCLFALSATVIAPYLFWRNVGGASFGLALVALLAWYLYRNHAVQDYFAFKASPVASGLRAWRPRPNPRHVRARIIVTLAASSLLLLLLPFIYGYFGDGARVTREAVLHSAEIQKACGTVGDFLIVPWGLSLQESDRDGQLEIAYWFKCGSSHGTVDAKYHHEDGPWIADSIVAHLGPRSFDLTHEHSE